MQIKYQQLTNIGDIAMDEKQEVETKPTFIERLREKARTSHNGVVARVLNTFADTIDEVESENKAEKEPQPETK